MNYFAFYSFTLRVRTVSRWLDTAPFYWICLRTGDKCKRHNGRWEHKFRSLSHVSRVILDTHLQPTRWIVDNIESGTVTVTLTIAGSWRSTVVLGRPLQFWSLYLPFFTHSCQHRLIAASLWPKCRAIVPFVFFFVIDYKIF